MNDAMNAMSPEAINRLARKRAGAKLGWYTHAAVFVLVNGALRYFGEPEGIATFLAHKETERHEHDDLYDI